MTLSEIKAAVDSGLRVHWSNKGYEVIKDKAGHYLVIFRPNGHCVGLTWQDGITLNEKESEFFIGE